MFYMQMPYFSQYAIILLKKEIKPIMFQKFKHSLRFPIFNFTKLKLYKASVP